MLKRSAMAMAVMALVLGLAGTAGADTFQSTHGSIFDANLGNSPGDLTVNPGASAVTITFDTDNRTVSANTGYGAHTFDVLRSQNYSTGNGVELAAFTFDSITLGGGTGSVTVNVTGNRGLVLGSVTDMTVESNVTFNLNGAQGVDQGGSSGWSAGGLGGSGAEGGPRLSYDSDPPGGTRGRGGNGYDGGNPTDGTGYGGGQAGSSRAGGSGGGYGGLGGEGEGSYGAVGQVYGVSELTTLYGGSGGAGGRGQHSSDVEAGGGGGGGAIQLVAITEMVFEGTINANGGRGGNVRSSGTIQVACGGGGSGGGVLLGAELLDFTGTINANGGRGGYDTRGGTYSYYQGGAGGGGRVAFYYDELDPGSSFANVSADGGPGWADGGENGSVGTINTNAGPFPYQVPPVPEPAGLSLLGLAAFGLRRRRS
jgi:MYXO-CTERM domain-containing protein